MLARWHPTAAHCHGQGMIGIFRRRSPCGQFSRLAPLALVVYVRSMGKAQSLDAFVCNETDVEVNDETSRILQQRVRTADEGPLVSADEARERIQRWLSKSATLKTR